MERLGVPHVVRDGMSVLDGDEAAVFERLLFRSRAPPPDTPPVRALSESSGIEIRPKFSISVGVRIGRPEKAAPRSMKPPIHSLFPVGDKGGMTRDLVKASRSPDFYTNVSLRSCPECSKPALGMKCGVCGGGDHTTKHVPVLQDCTVRRLLRQVPEEGCHPLVQGVPAQGVPDPGAGEYRIQGSGSRSRGSRRLVGQDRAAEPIEKGLLRQAHGLTVFKDGTVRYDATNATLTHFRPSWIGADVQRLRELGYTHDITGEPLENDEQTLELMVQDVILPGESGQYFVGAAKYVDELLEKFYGVGRYYNVRDPSQLVGTFGRRFGPPHIRGCGG